MATSVEAARERMVALMGTCDECGEPAVGYVRKVVPTGAVLAKNRQQGFNADGSPQVIQPGEFVQTSQPSEKTVRWCKAHKPKE